MSKLKKPTKPLIKTRKRGEPAPCELVKTVHGTEIPAIELQHIAPELRRFAVPVGSLKLDPHNARRHGDNDLAATRSSLEQFGQQHLAHYETGNRIVKVGNGRLQSAKALGWSYIAAIETNLTGAKLKAFALADNRTGELAGWNPEELQQQVEELADANFDVTSIGLGEIDLESLLKEAEQGAGGGDDSDSGQAPNFAPAPADSQSRLDQRKAIGCPHCGKEFVPGQE